MVRIGSSTEVRRLSRAGIPGTWNLSPRIAQWSCVLFFRPSAFIQGGTVVTSHLRSWIMQKSNCQIKYGDSGSAVTFRCGRYSVAECADCGKSICSDCRTECCGDSFCGLCFDCHLTHYQKCAE